MYNNFHLSQCLLQPNIPKKLRLFGQHSAHRPVFPQQIELQ